MNNTTIFGNFSFTSDQELNTIIDSINKEQSIYFLVEATKYAYAKGAFNLVESEILSKSIRTIYTPDSEPIENSEQ